MTSSPFDDLIKKIKLPHLASKKRGTDINKQTIGAILWYMHRLRAVYLDIQNASLPPNTFDPLTVDGLDWHYRIHIYYMTLISTILQLENALKKLKHRDLNEIRLPRSVEVRFFRNKLVEHCADYENGSQSGPTLWHPKKLSTPRFQRNILAVYEDYLAIKRMLAKELNVDESDLEDDESGRYGEIVYSALKKIDPKLRSEKHAKKKKQLFIPDALVNMLFKHIFPKPIYDIEKYSKDLVIEVESIIDKIQDA